MCERDRRFRIRRHARARKRFVDFLPGGPAFNEMGEDHLVKTAHAGLNLFGCSDLCRNAAMPRRVGIGEQVYVSPSRSSLHHQRIEDCRPRDREADDNENVDTVDLVMPPAPASAQSD
jgi:hypothetical protein